jgi:hypothetical protein
VLNRCAAERLLNLKRSPTLPTLARSASRIAALLLLAAAGPTPATEPLAEPLRAAVAQGMNLSKPVTIEFEWQPGAKSGVIESVRKALQAQGFSWSQTELRQSADAEPVFTIVAKFSGTKEPGALSKAMDSVNKLVAGSRSIHWSVKQVS